MGTGAIVLALGMVQAIVPTVQQATGPHAAPPTVLTVRAGGHATQIPMAADPTGPAVRADQLAAALGGALETLDDGRFRLTLPGTSLLIADGWPFAHADTGMIALPAPPYVARGHLYLPLATVADVVPHVATGVLYDPAHTELRVFAALPPPSQRHTTLAVAPLPREPTPHGTEPTLRSAPPADEGGAGTVDSSGDVLVEDSPDAGQRAALGAPEGAPVFTRHHLVVVDAGHGGPDNGMQGPISGGPQIREKDITLAVAMRLGVELRERGIEVVQTRTRDTLIALDDRGAMANAHHADAFVSIHVNAANPAWHDPSDARGFETYFLAEAKTEDARRVERMENEAVRFETGATASTLNPLNFIMKDMEQNEHLRESSELADLIQGRLARVQPGPNRGVKQAGFRVLVTAYMPAVLVEIGFGTNAAEARFLSDPVAQQRIAGAIASATADYLSRYDHRVSTAVR